MLYVAILGVFLSFDIAFTNSLLFNDSQRIIKDLLTGYNKEVAPQRRLQESVAINVTFHLRNILDLEEENEILMSSGWMKLFWFDIRLSWNRSNYGEVEDIYLSRGNLWIPDVTVDNAADDYYIVGRTSDILTINSNGRVEWNPGNIFKTKCHLDLTYFPFDEQTCEIILTTWTFPIDMVKFQNITAPMASVLEQHGEWDVTGITVDPDAFYQTVPNIIISLDIRRRSTFYILSIAVPVITATFVNAFVFLLPAESGEKITLSTALFLSYAVFLSSITDNMPKTSTTISILGVFVAAQLILSALSMFCTVAILKLHHRLNKGKDTKSSDCDDTNSFQEVSHKFDLFFFSVFLGFATLATGTLVAVMYLKAF